MDSMDQMISLVRICAYIMWVSFLLLIFLWLAVKYKFLKTPVEKKKTDKTMKNLRNSNFLFFYFLWSMIIITSILISYHYEYYREIVMYMILIFIPAVSLLWKGTISIP